MFVQPKGMGLGGSYKKGKGSGFSPTAREELEAEKYMWFLNTGCAHVCRWWAVAMVGRWCKGLPGLETWRFLLVSAVKPRVTESR